MDIQYKRTEGSQVEKPLEVDALSSSTKVYLRKNIERVTKIDPETEEPYEMWEYDEAIITHQEYEQWAAEEIARITPYTASKTAYIEDIEITFTDVPNGNLTVSMVDTEGNYPKYTVFRSGDKVEISFEPLQEVTTVTISVL